MRIHPFRRATIPTGGKKTKTPAKNAEHVPRGPLLAVIGHQQERVDHSAPPRRSPKDQTDSHSRNPSNSHPLAFSSPQENLIMQKREKIGKIENLELNDNDQKQRTVRNHHENKVIMSCASPNKSSTQVRFVRVKNDANHNGE